MCVCVCVCVSSRPGHTKDHYKKMAQAASLHRHACVRVGVW